MTKIKLTTFINAPVQRCFDLSRSITLHEKSTEKTKEKAIGGRLSGLLELDDFVIWQAKHLGVTQKLTTKITFFKSPTYFVDEMVKGAFKAFNHEHIFTPIGKNTEMIDVFNYTSPLGFIGRLFDVILLKKYMTQFLVNRNQTIKRYAESDQWRKVLKQ